MTPKKAGLLQLGLALIFAIAMLMASWLLRGSEHRDTVVFSLIAVWWIPFSALLVVQGGHSIQDELRCLKRRTLGLFGRRP